MQTLREFCLLFCLPVSQFQENCKNNIVYCFEYLWMLSEQSVKASEVATAQNDLQNWKIWKNPCMEKYLDYLDLSWILVKK